MWVSVGLLACLTCYVFTHHSCSSTLLCSIYKKRNLWSDFQYSTPPIPLVTSSLLNSITIIEQYPNQTACAHLPSDLHNNEWMDILSGFSVACNTIEKHFVLQNLPSLFQSFLPPLHSLPLVGLLCCFLLFSSVTTIEKASGLRTGIPSLLLSSLPMHSGASWL